MFKKKLDKNLIMSIQPTSVATLKSQCYIIADGDVDEAQKLFEYFSSGLEGLPAFEPKEPSGMDKVKAVVGDGMGWIKENQDGILQFVQVMRGMFGKGGTMPPMGGGTMPPNVPPLDPIN